MTTNTNNNNDQQGLQALQEQVVPFSWPLPPQEEEQIIAQMVPGRAEVVLLGECTHGTEEFYRLRHQITKHLVLEKGFRAVLLEAEWPDIYNVNLHLIQAKSPYPSVEAALAQIQGHGKHMWQNHETIALLEWIKKFNASQQYRSDSMVYVFGIDCQQIYRSLNVLYNALAEMDFALCQDLKARLSFFNGHGEDEHEYARKTVRGIGSENIPEILQTILSEFQWKHFDRLKDNNNATTEKRLSLLNIEQSLEVLVNGEEYFRKMILEPAGSNVSWNTRDQHMALTVSRIRERLPLVTNTLVPTKVIVWAHNSHIGNSAFTARGGSDFVRNENWNLGQMVRSIVPRCFALGLSTYQGTVTALTDDKDNTTKAYTLRPAVEGSSERMCHEICEKRSCQAFWLPLDPETIGETLCEALSARRLHRYVGVHYRPDTEIQSHYNQASLVGQYDALVFINQTTALRVLTPQELQTAAGGKSTSSVQSPASNYGVRRLMQEYVRLKKQPIPHIRIATEEDNIYKCHFLLTFDSGVYTGGEYHGLLDLPQSYPMAPPRLSFYTPSGRFETGERICVSFSDYHPELWNPSWGIESVLVGLQSFMQEECPEAVGSLWESSSKRKQLAKESQEFNMKDDLFVQLFVKDADDDEEMAYECNEEKKDEEELRYCRYCRAPGGELVSPCNCKGSNEFTHKECLAKWQYQAILSQNTHPKYQTGLEKICNVCQSEFKIKAHSREKLMISFTGAEMANMIAHGCLLVATERSSRRNVELMQQYTYLADRLRYWTNSVYLITERMTSKDRKKQSIVGVNMTQEIKTNDANRNSQFLARLGLPTDTRQFVGGPVCPDEPNILIAACRSKLKSESPEFCRRVLQDDDNDLSVWVIASHQYIPGALAWAGDAFAEARVYWGCACWDRVQLLGEIARGGWGVANGHIGLWQESVDQSWQSTLARAIFAGSNDFSKF